MRLPRSAPLTLAAAVAALVFACAPAVAAAEPPEAPETKAVTEIAGMSATFNGVLNPGLAPQSGTYRFVYRRSATECEGESASAGGGVLGLGPESVSEPVTGLEPNTEYTVCLVASNITEQTIGNAVPFKTETIKPTIKSESASPKATEAHLEATVNPNNSPTECHFQYGTTSVEEHEAECEQGNALSGGEQGVGVTVSGLTQHTSYQFRVLVKNTAGEEAGKTEPFETTLPPETPEAKPANPVTANTATLNGILNPNAEGEPGTSAFIYRQSASECTGEGQKEAPSEPPASVGEKEEAVHAAITELLPHTAYTFCLRARNREESGEEAISPPQTFTTAVAAPTVEAYASEVAATSATFNANINPQGGETSYVFEYAPAGGSFVSVAEPEGHGSIPEGTTAVPVSVHVQHGLAAHTAYQFRVMLSNSAGETTSETVSFTTQAAGSFTLLDGRQWEMVSPPAKEGALIAAPDEEQGGNLAEAAADGSAISYQTNVPTENAEAGYSDKEQVLSVRTRPGWVSHDISSAHNRATGHTQFEGREYRFFSEDLSQAIVQPVGAFLPCESAEHEPQPCLSPHASGQTAFLRDLTSNIYTPLVTGCPAKPTPCPKPVEEAADVPEGTTFGGGCPPRPYCGPYFEGSTPDAQHIVFSLGGLDEWSAGATGLAQLQPVSVLPVEEGGELAGGILGGYTADWAPMNARQAISRDGSRVFWTSEIKIGSNLYLRDVKDKETLRIGTGAQFQLASADGSLVFYSEGLRLFECEIPDALPLACNRRELGEAAGLLIGASKDDSYLYFVSPADQLFVDHFDGHEWHKTLVATLSAEDNPDWAEAETLAKMTARVSPDGRWLAFMSERELTGYDNHDLASGRADEELFLYHAPVEPAGEAGSLACVSCNPTGARPSGVRIEGAGGSMRRIEGEQVWKNHDAEWLAADVPGWFEYEGSPEAARYQPRYLSNSGRVFFDAHDALVPKDINNNWDVYEYEPEGAGGCGASAASGSVVFKPGGGSEQPGCVGLISSGESSEESVFIDASESGEDAFFMTTGKLAPQDTDSSYDVYDAHLCTIASPCIAPPSGSPAPCATADACRSAPTPQPGVFGAPPSATFTGPGNVTAPGPPAAKGKTAAQIRAEKLKKALATCRKKYKHHKHKRATCERKAKRAYSAAHKAKAGPKRGG